MNCQSCSWSQRYVSLWNELQSIPQTTTTTASEPRQHINNGTKVVCMLQQASLYKLGMYVYTYTQPSLRWGPTTLLSNSKTTLICAIPGLLFSNSLSVYVSLETWQQWITLPHRLLKVGTSVDSSFVMQHGFLYYFTIMCVTLQLMWNFFFLHGIRRYSIKRMTNGSSLITTITLKS